MVRNQTVEFGGVHVAPGERKTVDLEVARLFTHNPMQIPIQVINGRRSGPRLFVSAVIHGDEIIGVEIIRRLMNLKILRSIKGTLVAIPVLNVFGFTSQTRYLPDRKDLNRFFPGNESGSLTSRLADLLMTEVVQKCTHGIDLHSGTNHRENLPQIRAYLENEESLELANAFGAPVVMSANLLEGSLRQAAHDANIPMLLYEAGEAHRFNESYIKLAIKGIISVMRSIGMLPESRRRPKIHPLLSRSSTWVRAPISGIVSSKIKLGDRVAEGRPMGKVVDPYGEESSEIISKADGVVVGRLNLPLVYRGDAIFHIARVDDADSSDSTMEAYRQEFEPDN